MRRKILSIFLVAAVATLVGVVVSCSPAPETGGPAQVEPIPKTLLFENTSDVATNLLRAVYYERTETAHKFYVKTTVNVTNYLGELRSLEPGIGDDFVSRTNTGDIWGLLIIGIDRASKSTAKKNVAKFGTVVRTADPNFEFDAVIRLNSSWQDANLRDGIPVRAEAGTWYLEFYTSGDNEVNNYWAVREEKKFQAADNDNDGPASKFLSGAYTVLTNEYDDNTNTYRVDANIAYDANTGEYILTIPFTVIDANDINKITAFGMQNSGWRPGATINAVIKPLGSDRVIVYADNNGVVSGLPVVTVPKKKDESPVLTPGSFGDVSLISLNPSSFFIIAGGSGTVEVEVTVRSTISNDTGLPLYIVGPQGNNTITNSYTVYYEKKVGGLHYYTNKITLNLGTSSGDFYNSSSYNLSFATTNNAVASFPVIVGIINVDGDSSDSAWTGALSIDDPADDTQGGAGADITNMKITNDSAYLYIMVMYKTGDWYGGGENPRNVIFVSTDDATGALRLIDVSGFDWVNAVQTNEVKFDMFVLHNANGWGVFAKSDGSAIEGWSNSPTKWAAGPSVMNNVSVVEYRIKLSDIGVSVNQTIKVGFSVINPGHTGLYEYETVGTNDNQFIPMFSYTIK